MTMIDRHPARHTALAALLALLLSAASNPAPAAPPPPDERMGFPAQCRITSGVQLVLQSAERLRYLGFKVYDAALYTPEGKAGRANILDNRAKRLELRYHRGIDRDDIVEASEKALQKNPGLDLPALRERIDRAYAAYASVEEGDRYSITWVPGKGTEFRYNDELRDTIEGEDFMRAFFGIWLSEHPLSESLRNRLLEAGD